MPESRQIQLETRRADAKQRLVPATISSTYPVDRADFDEVLLHGRENIDLSRAPLPLIESHDGSRLNIGDVDDLHVTQDRLRGVVRFGNSARAEEIWNDVLAGIVRNVSIGYQVHDHESAGDTLYITKWTPLEVSLVSVPADPSAGLNRSYKPTQDQNMSDENNGAPAAENAEHMTRSQRRAERASATAERERVNEITEIARQYKSNAPRAPELANDAIRNGDSVDQYQAKILDELSGDNGRPQRTLGDQGGSYGPSAQTRNRDQSYSVSRALQSMIDPKSTDAGFEREVSQDIARRSGRKPRGMYMPMGELSQRALNGMNVGGSPAMVGTEHLGGSFIDALYARSVVMGLNPMMLSGLTGDASIPRLAESASAAWLAADGSDAIGESDPTFDAVNLSPKTVGALVKISRKMVLQGDPGAEDVIRNDLAQVIAAELDRAAIQGSGTGNEPAGVVNIAGVSTGNFASAKPTFAEMVEMESSLQSANVEASSAAYVTTPALAGSLKTTTIADAGDQMIWSPSQQSGEGIVNGLRAYSTTNCPAQTAVLGNWSDFIMGMWGGVDIDVNPYLDFSRGVIGVRAFASVDFGVRHEPSFSVYTVSNP